MWANFEPLGLVLPESKAPPCFIPLFSSVESPHPALLSGPRPRAKESDDGEVVRSDQVEIIVEKVAWRNQVVQYDCTRQPHATGAQSRGGRTRKSAAAFRQGEPRPQLCEGLARVRVQDDQTPVSPCYNMKPTCLSTMESYITTPESLRSSKPPGLPSHTSTQDQVCSRLLTALCYATTATTAVYLCKEPELQRCHPPVAALWQVTHLRLGRRSQGRQAPSTPKLEGSHSKLSGNRSVGQQELEASLECRDCAFCIFLPSQLSDFSTRFHTDAASVQRVLCALSVCVCFRWFVPFFQCLCCFLGESGIQALMATRPPYGPAEVA